MGIIDAQDGWGGGPAGFGLRGDWGKPPSLHRHDEQYHGGHYDGGACRFRDEWGRRDKADSGLSVAGFHPGKEPRPDTRSVGKKGAKMPLDAASSVAPGKVAVLSSADFKETMASIPKADKVMALSDVHDTDAGAVDFSKCGTVVMAGDFTQHGATSESQRIDMEAAKKGGMEWLEKEFRPMCERQPDRQFVVIAGNHDHFLASDEIADYDWPENVKYLCDSETTVNGMRIYGSPWCAQRKKGAVIYAGATKYAQRPFEVDEAVLAEKYAKIPEGLDVLVVHQPPKAEGFDGDVSYASGGAVHSGSEELTAAILRAKPKLVICGHLHDGDHRPFKIGDSVVVNSAYVYDRFTPGFTPHEIGVKRGTAEEGGNGFILDGENDHVVPVKPKPQAHDVHGDGRWRDSFLEYLNGGFGRSGRESSGAHGRDPYRQGTFTFWQ